MTLVTQYTYSSPPPGPLALPEAPVIAPPIGGSASLADRINAIYQSKKTSMETALKDKWSFNNVVFISGDLFTFGSLGFQALQCFAPKTQQLAGFVLGSFIFGEVAGAINIFVGIGCLKTAIEYFKIGAIEKGTRQLLDFFCMVGIGAVMILVSLAVKIGALAGVGAFFAANPWFLPLLFFIVTLPVFIELGKALIRLYQKADLGSKLQLDTMKSFIDNGEWEGLFDWMTTHNISLAPDEKLDFAAISSKMEDFQIDFGIEAAMEVFDLWTSLLEKNKEKALLQLQAAKKALAEWNWSLYVRMFQQILYIVGFIISMGCLKTPEKTANLLNGTQNLFLTGANAIPTYMDIYWPFKRNSPLVVPEVK